MMRKSLGCAALATGGACATAAAALVPAVPLAAALLPLPAALWWDSRWLRAAAMAGYMAPPVAVCAWGLAGTGVPPAAAVAGGLPVLAALCVLAAATGLPGAALLLLAVPVFPASPVLPLAALTPGAGIHGLAAALLALTAIGILPRRARRVALAAATAALLAWGASAPPVPTPPGWRQIPVPATLTERARWIALRDSLPTGGTAILGENVFGAADGDAVAFWCRAAEDRTIIAGVAVDGGGIRRGEVWRFDRRSCARPGRRHDVVARARLGIPGLTGRWTPMPAATDADPPLTVLVCLEAFLPWAWASAGPGGGGPVAVLSNDTAFGGLPVHVLRRKAARAMAGLDGRPVLFAETGRSAIVAPPPEMTAAP